MDAAPHLIAADALAYLIVNRNAIHKARQELSAASARIDSETQREMFSAVTAADDELRKVERMVNRARFKMTEALLALRMAETAANQ